MLPVIPCVEWGNKKNNNKPPQKYIRKQTKTVGSVSQEVAHSSDKGVGVGVRRVRQGGGGKAG